MLKLACIFIFTTLFAMAYTQPQREPVYKYSYDFSVTISSACRTSVSQDSAITKTQQPLLEIDLKDCINSPIPFATVYLKRDDTSAIARISDGQGLFSIGLAQGEYTLTISSVGIKTFTKKISLNQYQRYQFRIVLQAETFTEHYTVSSKTKLTDKDIERIKHCIITANGKAYKCNEKNTYRIMTWI